MTAPGLSLDNPFPDEAHNFLLQYVKQLILMSSALNVVAGTATTGLTTSQIDRLAIHAQLDAAVAQLAAAVLAAASEVTARTNADSALTANLAAEITRATQAEAQLRTDQAASTALTARVAALEARALRGTTGTAPLSSLAATGTQAVNVTFVTPMPDANYTALIALDTNATIQLGSVSPVYPVTNKTKTGCTVTVRNTGLSLVSNIVVQVSALSLS